jgi:hypothetical protein
MRGMVQGTRREPGTPLSVKVLVRRATSPLHRGGEYETALQLRRIVD